MKYSIFKKYAEIFKQYKVVFFAFSCALSTCIFANYTNAQSEVSSSQDTYEETQSQNAVTIFGISFENNLGEVNMKLSRRFKCEISLNEKDDWGQEFRCDVGMGGTVFWTKTNTLGELVRISFACKTFQGCDYKREELFKILTLQNPSIGEPTQHGAFRMCGYAELGERVCFGEANTLIFYKGKFGKKPVNFN